MRFSSVTLCAVILASCSDPAAPGIRVGDIVRASGEIVPVRLPANARVGESFLVIVEPSLDCGSRAAGVEAGVAGLIADVTPLVTVPPEGTRLCAIVPPYADTAVVKFNSPGSAIVRVHGRDQRTAASSTVERVVTVGF